MARASIAIAQSVIDSLWQRNEAFTADVASTARFHLQGQLLDRQPFRQIVATDLLFALPDLRMRIRDALCEPPAGQPHEDGTSVVALRMSCEGTHTGVLFGVPASGENISFSVALWLHFQGAQVVAMHVYWNKFAAHDALVAARQRATAATTGVRAHPSTQ